MLSTAACLAFFPKKSNAQILQMGYNHVALAVANIDSSAKFYREIVGLEPIAVPEELRAIRSWFKIGPGQELHLLAGRSATVSNNDRNGAHFALTIPDADVAEAFLKKIGLPYHRQQRFDKAFQIYITDPDGYVIELNEPKAQPPADTLASRLEAALVAQKINSDIWKPYAEAYSKSEIGKFAALHSPDFIACSSLERAEIASFEKYIATFRAFFEKNRAAGKRAKIEVRFFERILSGSLANEYGIFKMSVAGELDSFLTFQVMHRRSAAGKWVLQSGYFSDEGGELNFEDWESALGSEDLEAIR